MFVPYPYSLKLRTKSRTTEDMWTSLFSAPPPCVSHMIRVLKKRRREHYSNYGHWYLVLGFKARVDPHACMLRCLWMVDLSDSSLLWHLLNYSCVTNVVTCLFSHMLFQAKAENQQWDSSPGTLGLIAKRLNPHHDSLSQVYCRLVGEMSVVH